MGIIPGAGATQHLIRAVGKPKAIDMCLTGRRMDAEEAERCGLVSRVFPVDQLVDKTVEIAQGIAEFSQTAASMVTETVDHRYDLTLSEGVLFERWALNSMISINDQKEGMAAFVEKRKPTRQNS